MARAIDADRLLQVLETNFGHTGGADVMRQLIEAQPTLTPPNEPLTPCDVCRFSPPSSRDGKPCCMCPAERRPPEGEEDT